MIKIRYNVFETNSSSTHSLCVAQNDEIDKLKNNELLVYKGWRRGKGYLITYKDALDELKEYLNKYGDDEEKAVFNSGDRKKIFRLLYELDIAERFDSYIEPGYLEPYEEEFTTKSGDRVLVFGRYGHD